MNRRDFLATSGSAALFPSIGFAQTSPSADILKLSTSRVPTRAITSGPKHHWFAYYDKLQFDPGNRLVLSNEVGFEHRTPNAKDQLRVGMIDLEDGDRWTDLGKSDAWGWQQGCMLQWIPGTESSVIWNDREDDRFVSHILDVKSGRKRTLPHPVYALDPNGKFAITADFARIQRLRPGYGYQGIPDRTAKDPRPEDSGIRRLDLETGRSELIISIADVARFGSVPGQKPESHHWFNHLLVNPDGTRFIFLHRWRTTPSRWNTRMLTANTADGSDIRIVDDNGMTSHFIWRDPSHILAWSNQKPHGKAFYLFDDSLNPKPPKGMGPKSMSSDGHCTYLHMGDGTEWILNDTYPRGPHRQQCPYLYHVTTGKRHELGKFHLPPPYKGEWRCDTHPRSSNDGRFVTIDSPHGGTGRQVWLLDVSDIVG